ncbi:hypothetical protein HY633_01820 [Candidatus Uhrbacteria bacterium]|nr:hypothetical protein [Candidatus Uhrbacteria bacterium]
MPSSGIILVILIGVIAFDLGLGAGLFAANRNSLVVQKFSLFTLSLAFWTLTIIGFFVSYGDLLALVWMRLAYVGGLSVAITFWYFVIKFPRQLKLNRWINAANLLTLAIFFWIIIATPFIVRSVEGGPWNRTVTLNPAGWYVFASFFLFFFLYGHAILFVSYLRSKGLERIHLKYIVTSVFIGGEIFGTYFNLILPSPLFLNWNYIWVGPLVTAAIIVPSIGYAVAKYQLLNIKVVATEIFVTVSVILAFVDTLLYRGFDELIMRLTIAFGVTILGVQLVRSVNREVQRREELQRLTTQLAEANVHLKELDEAKSDFISIASHQLRTPVSVIKGYLALFMDDAYGRMPVKARPKVRSMFVMNERLVQLINNLLNISRIEKKKIEFILGPTNVVELARNIVREMALRAREKGIELKMKVAGHKALFANADESKLKEVLANLIDNAIKYSPSGTVTISVDPDAGGAEVLLRVADTGIGLKPDQVSKLFNKYYRVESPETATIAGTGLGLYVCDTFVRGMGGTIFIEKSAPGKGTTFTVSLPAGKK